MVTPEQRAVPVNDPARDGHLLAGLTIKMIGLEFVQLTLGARHRDTRATHAYLGLDDPDRPPPPVHQIRGWDRRAAHTAATLRPIAAGMRFRPEAWPTLTLPAATPGAQQRLKRLLGLLALPAPANTRRTPAWWSRDAAAAAGIGRRVLTAAGPLTLGQVARAVDRAHATSSVPPIGWDVLVASLTAAGARRVILDNRWNCVGAARPRDAALIAAARHCGRAVHTDQQIAELLTAAGWSPAGAHSTARRHPLIDRLARNTYRILGADQAS